MCQRKAGACHQVNKFMINSHHTRKYKVIQNVIVLPDKFFKNTCRYQFQVNEISCYNMLVYHWNIWTKMPVLLLFKKIDPLTVRLRSKLTCLDKIYWYLYAGYDRNSYFIRWDQHLWILLNNAYHCFIFFKFKLVNSLFCSIDKEHKYNVNKNDHRTHKTAAGACE